jgi:hypothetical protein
MSDGINKNRITDQLVNMARTVESKLTKEFEGFKDLNLVFNGDAKFVAKRESAFKELEVYRK